METNRDLKAIAFWYTLGFLIRHELTRYASNAISASAQKVTAAIVVPIESLPKNSCSRGQPSGASEEILSEKQRKGNDVTPGGEESSLRPVTGDNLNISAQKKE